MNVNENTLWQEVQFVRDAVLQEVEKVSEDAADKMPEGFRNTIRWNLGHIYVVQESLVTGLAGQDPLMPPRYQELFAPGTKPADWTGDIPDLSELRTNLKEQPGRLQEQFAGRMDEKVDKPFQPGGGLELSTIGELVNFTVYHEGLHTGFIKGLKRAIGM